MNPLPSVATATEAGRRARPGEGFLPLCRVQADTFGAVLKTPRIKSSHRKASFRGEKSRANRRPDGVYSLFIRLCAMI